MSIFLIIILTIIMLIYSVFNNIFLGYGLTISLILFFFCISNHFISNKSFITCDAIINPPHEDMNEILPGNIL